MGTEASSVLQASAAGLYLSRPVALLESKAERSYSRGVNGWSKFCKCSKQRGGPNWENTRKNGRTPSTIFLRILSKSFQSPSTNEAESSQDPTQILSKSSPNPCQILPKSIQKAFWSSFWTNALKDIALNAQKASTMRPKVAKSLPRAPQTPAKLSPRASQIHFSSYFATFFVSFEIYIEFSLIFCWFLCVFQEVDLYKTL